MAALAAGPGGLTAHWSLQPDLLVVGKSIASGIPLGAYGMRADIAAVLEPPPGASWGEQVAIGRHVVRQRGRDDRGSRDA